MAARPSALYHFAERRPRRVVLQREVAGGNEGLRAVVAPDDVRLEPRLVTDLDDDPGQLGGKDHDSRAFLSQEEPHGWNSGRKGLESRENSTRKRRDRVSAGLRSREARRGQQGGQRDIESPACAHHGRLAASRGKREQAMY